MFVAVGIQHSVRMCCVMSSVACLAVQYFSTLSHKRHDFRKTVICVLWLSLQLLSATFLILRRNERDMIINVYWSTSTCYPCQILTKLGFSRQIFQKYSNTKFHEYPSNVSRVFPCRRMDRSKLSHFFEIFANTPKN